MASVRCIDVQARPTAFLDFTSLTLDEFQLLVPPFEAAFQAHMAAWCLDGKPRATRQFTVYKPMVLVSYILYNYANILQTKFSNRERHEA
jgi:hypothetical protein